MARDIDTFINLVIPTSLFGDNRLTLLERLLLMNILSLCKEKGYRWATNEYFKNFFNVSKQTISKSISSLSKYGYIVLEYDKKEKNNTKRNNIGPIISKDVDGVKLWNGKRCESEPMSEEEQKELKDWLSSIE